MKERSVLWFGDDKDGPLFRGGKNSGKFSGLSKWKRHPICLKMSSWRSISKLNVPDDSNQSATSYGYGGLQIEYSPTLF